MMEFKAAAFELATEADGSFEGYASVFGNVDQGMDVIEAGAFAKTLKKRKVRMLWQHSADEIIGVWDEVREDIKGLFVKGRLLSDVQKGREALALLRAGAIDSMSIGFRTVEAEEDGRKRRLKEVDLYEVSLVTFPMNERAMVTAVKAEDGTFNIRELERALRDVLHLSQSEAKALLADGFKGLKATRDVGADAEPEGLAALLSQVRQLKEKIHV